jgi:hypothetical protein
METDILVRESVHKLLCDSTIHSNINVVLFNKNYRKQIRDCQFLKPTIIGVYTDMR